jgi:RHS repeat-associated protein
VIPAADARRCPPRGRAALGLLVAIAACRGQPPPPARAPASTDARVVAALTGGAPCAGGACAPGAFQYDTGGRLVRDRGAALAYDAFDQLVAVTPVAGATSGVPAAPLAHTYGFDGLRTSTTQSPGASGAAVQLWFTQDYTEHGGAREHYVRVGDRIVAKLTLAPPAGGAAGPVRTTGGTAPAAAAQAARAVAPLLFAAALALVAARVVSRRRRPGWGAAAAGPAALALLASCAMLDGTERATAALWQRTDTVYFHRGIAPGPVLTTNADGSLREERRYEPFGQPVDATLGGAAAVVDFRREPQNALGKLTDPATGWSYHGARWLEPATARWHSPDPAVASPSGRMLATPWDLNPYAYVTQSPTLYWDPDGEDAYMIVFTNRPADDVFRKAADTRKAEIEASPSFDPKHDHVYEAGVLDLGRLRDQVDVWVKDAKTNNYGRTVAFDVFGHTGGRDGPRADMTATGPSKLGDDQRDDRQMSPAGWAAIDFNWDTERSIAVFHGCHSFGFAQKFKDLQPDLNSAAGFRGFSYPSQDPLFRLAPLEIQSEVYFVGGAYGGGRIYPTDPEPISVTDDSGMIWQEMGDPGPLPRGD